MMYYIKGRLEELNPDRAVVDCGGVGYSAMITAKTYESLSEQGVFDAGGETNGGEVKLYTFARIADESRFELFGFADKKELSMFVLLQTVSGIGTRAAMSILSALTVESVCGAVLTEDTKLIATAQGVGQKAAQKICIDLKNKMEKFMLENGVGYGAAASYDAQKDSQSAVFGENEKLAVEALMNLGYSKNEAKKAVSKVSGGTAEDIIRKALANLI